MKQESNDRMVARLMMGRIFHCQSTEAIQKLDSILKSRPGLKRLLVKYSDRGDLIRDALNYVRVDADAAWEEFKVRAGIKD